MYVGVIIYLPIILKCNQTLTWEFATTDGKNMVLFDIREAMNLGVI